jgi:uncharacterized protein YgiM (DUF1202 family)
MRKVLKPYEVKYLNAIRVRKGSSLLILREETNPAWKGWLWCRSEDGQEGWISKDYMDIQGSKAIMNRDYDAREVAVQASEMVQVLNQENGWSWVRKSDGSEGWIPSENLE